MNLGEFTQQIKDNIRRGSSMDDLVPGFIRKAALWLERNNSLNYMKKFAQVSVDLESEDPRYISLIDTRIKAVKLFRWVGDDGQYIPLVNRNPNDFTSLDVGTPLSFWLDGISNIVLAATPDKALTGDLWIERYSSWPTAAGATHWLIDFAEDVLEAQTMINFAKHSRDADATQFWGKIRDEGLVGLYAAEQEFTYSSSDLRMEYNGQ